VVLRLRSNLGDGSLYDGERDMKPRHQWESIVEKAQHSDFAALDPDLWEPILYAHEHIEELESELGRRYARIRYLEARLKNIEEKAYESIY